MKHTSYIIALALAIALPLNIAAAQTDPLADLFANPSAIADPVPAAAATPATDTVAPATTDAAVTPTVTSAYLVDVVGITATAVAGGAELSWDAVEGADAYTIHYGPVSVYDAAGGTYSSTIELDNVTSYTATGLTAGTPYFFAVTAENLVNGTGSEFYSDEVSVTPLVAGAAPVAEPVASSTTVTVAAEPLHGAAPATLPQSGPLTGALLVSAIAGAYAWRRRQA